MAFRKAIELGCSHIETDLHRSRDGAIVCFHDANLDRTTDGRGPLKERTLAELRTLDAAHRFSPDGATFPLRGRGDPELRIPTLEDAVALHPTVRFNVEIKQRTPDMCQAVHDFIVERGLTDRFLVAAADPAIERRFRRINRGRIATSASSRSVLRFWLGVRTGLHRLDRYPFDALQVPRRQGALRVVDDRFVRAAHAHGLQVHVWTIDDPGEMQRLLDLGVDGIVTDRPDLLMALLRERGARS